MKNYRPPDIYPRNKCTKFQPNPIIVGLCTLRCPEDFGTYGSKIVPRAGSKNENFEKMKKTPQVFYPQQVLNFSLIQPFLGSVGFPKVFGDRHP